MFKQKPFPLSVLALIVLIALHLGGSFYSLYWVYPGFDIVVHIVSGFWVALIFLWLALIWGQMQSLSDYQIKSLLIALVSALFVGVVWELVENFSQVTFTKSIGYSFNTALDLFNDGLGGLLAYLYFVRRKKCTGRACDILHPLNRQVEAIRN